MKKAEVWEVCHMFHGLSTWPCETLCFLGFWYKSSNLEMLTQVPSPTGVVCEPCSQTTHYLPNFVQNGSLFKKTEPRCLRNIYGKIEMPYMFFKMCGYKDSRCKSCWNHGKDHLKIGLCKLATAQHMMVISSACWIIFIGNSCNRILKDLILLALPKC